jgi:cytochrome P450
MAMLEIQLVLAQIVQRYRVELIAGHPVESIAKVTLKQRYGLPLKLTRRRKRG